VTAPVQTQPQPVLTPEQMRIKELEAQLAAATATKPRKPRPKPVGPPVTNGGAPAQAQAQPVTPQSNGAAAVQEPQPAGEATVGNAIADRIAAITGQKAS